MTEDPRVEAVARALCEERGEDPDEEVMYLIPGTAFEEGEPPPCWTDGVCWAVNEDGEPSTQPTHWKSQEPKS